MKTFKKIILLGLWGRVASLSGMSSAPSRRSVLEALVLANTVLIPTGSCSAQDEEAECQRGVVVTESAIPGAYQSMCMLQEERRIPFQKEILTIQQGSSVGAGRTGVAVWNSCLLLTRLLEQTGTDYVRDKTVLELGCGTGLASIACARLGAARVIATDGNPTVVELARDNAERNKARVVETANLPWGLLDAMEFSDAADVVMGSDLTYNSGTWRVLAETINTVLKPGGCFLYLTLGHSGFNVKGELDGFLQVIAAEGLVVEPTKLEQQLSLSSQEQSVLDGTGGVRVLLLRKPALRKLS